MSTKTMTKPDNEASPAMRNGNKKWMPIIIEAVKEMPTLCVWSRSPHRPEWCRPDAPRRKNTALNKLLCFENQISGQNMDALIGSLRQNESEEFCEFYVMDGNEPNQNVCTKSQVAAAKAKGWLPQYWDEDEEAWLEYEGSEPIREKK